MSLPDDKEFEPTIEMMIHDFDDEQTLEEEERLAVSEQKNPDEELDQLQKEGDMPLEELLAMYYNQPMGTGEDDEESFDDEDDDEHNFSTSKEKDAPLNDTPNPETQESDNEESDLKRLYPEGVNSLNAILAAAEESDCDYEPEESENRKKIMIGSEHQAEIPEVVAQPVVEEKQDELIWSGEESLNEEDIVEYLKQVKQLLPPSSNSETTTIEIPSPSGNRHIRDDEKALSVLQQCGYNINEAINKFKSDLQASQNPWTEEECEKFETGLQTHGKNFHQIQLLLPSKSFGDLVQFYYHWKKSERYDAFISRHGLNKRKYNAISGQCIMDRFLEDQEGSSINGANGMHLRDRALLTVNNSLLSADTKRHRPNELQSSSTAATSTKETSTLHES
uniref:CSON007257 protein n=1 Tax=Culicoides sonorensis TaxID=179676 RepID=A0A336M1G2_CULSO